MSESNPAIINQSTLEKKVRSLRSSERIGRFLGSFSITVAGIDAIGMIVAQNVTPVTMGIEGGSLFMGCYSALLCASEGRQADVLDAELLQRQRLTQEKISNM